MLKDKKIGIIGAGLTGLMLAIYLARRGYQVTIFERRTSEQLLSDKNYESGRVLSLDISRRGFIALSEIGLEDVIRSHMVPMRTREIHMPEEVLSIPYGSSDKEYISTISRFRLHQALVSKANRMSEINIQFGHQFVSYDSERKRILFNEVEHQREKWIHADIVLGCDGAHSNVRSYIENITQSRFKKFSLPFHYKVFAIPKEQASALTFQAMHMWPRENMMLVAQPNFDGSFVAALIVPVDGQNTYAQLEKLSSKQIEAFFEYNFKDAVSLIPNYVQEMQENPVGQFYAIKGEQWHVGNETLLLGDAVHAMPPFLGQGVNSCFEDCYYLNRYLELLDDNWELVIPHFERNRKADAESITRMSYENYPELTHIDWRHFIMQRKVEQFIMSQFKPFYISYHNLICFHTVPYYYAENIRTIQKDLIQKVTQKVLHAGSLSKDMMSMEFIDYMKKKACVDERMLLQVG